MPNYIKIIDENLAQKIWDNSNESNIYNNPNFLISSKKIIYYGCFLENEIVSVWPIKEQDNIGVIPWNYYYFGPYLTNSINLKPLHSKINKILLIYELFMLHFKSIYKEINFNLHWINQDIRYFYWLSEKFTFLKIIYNIKYTALIKGYSEKKSWRNLRIRQLKKINKINNLFYIKNCNEQISNSEYMKIIKENIPIDYYKNNKFSYEELISICQKAGHCFNIFQKNNNELIGFACILEDKISHHLVFNFVKNEWKKKGLMVYLFDYLFDNCFKKGIEYFDFNGANSFKGADEKSAYGSYQNLYINMKIKFS